MTLSSKSSSLCELSVTICASSDKVFFHCMQYVVSLLSTCLLWVICVVFYDTVMTFMMNSFQPLCTCIRGCVAL